jgi:hypothetical protein
MANFAQSPLRLMRLRRRTGFPLRRQTLPSPRPSGANIRLKFEGCFKGRDESNLNVHAARRLPISIKHAKAANIAIFADAQQSVTLAVGAMLTMRPERLPLGRNRKHALAC